MKPTPKTLLLLALLLLAVAIAYWPTLQGLFVYDEVESITRNPMLFQAPLAKILFTHSYFNLSQEATYRPLVTFSYLFDNAMWGMAHPGGWRFDSLLLHLLCVGLLFGLLRQMAVETLPAWIAAALFGLHPLHVEAVASIGFREDLLAAAGLLAMALVYQLWRQGLLNNALAAMLTALAVFLAQMAKENAFMAPLLLAALVACDEWSVAQPPPAAVERLRRAAPLLGAVLGTTLIAALIRFVLMRNVSIATISPSNFPLLGSWLRAPWIFITNGLLPVFLPYHLRPDRAVVMANIGPVAIALGWLVLLWLIWIGARIARRGPLEALGVLWYALLWLPTANLVPLFVPAADRYAYAPDLGLALIAAGLLQKVLATEKETVDEVDEVDNEDPSNPSNPSDSPLSPLVFSRQDLRNVVVAGAAVLLLFLGFLTYRQLQLWQTIETLWTYEYGLEPHSLRALHSLAFNDWAKAQREQAMGHDQMAQAYQQQAIQLSKQAIQFAPTDKDSQLNYAVFLMDAGDYADAQPIFERIVQVLPNDRMANDALGKIYLTGPQRDPAKALHYMRQAEAGGYPEDPRVMRQLEQEK